MRVLFDASSVQPIDKKAGYKVQPLNYYGFRLQVKCSGKVFSFKRFYLILSITTFINVPSFQYYFVRDRLGYLQARKAKWSEVRSTSTFNHDYFAFYSNMA